MSAGPVAYGIDFGTTNSSIAIAYPDRVQVVEMTDAEISTALPSIMYLHRNGDRAAGMDAVEQYLITGAYRTLCPACSLGPRRTDCRQFRPGGGCQDSRLMYGLKADLGQPGFSRTHSWAIDFELPDLIAIVLRRLKRGADRVSGKDVRRAVFGYPVAFAGTEGADFEVRQQLALDRLLEAGKTAGFNEIELYPEPAAAVLDETVDDGFLLSLDFGGGTFDAALVEYRAGQGEIIALQGAAIGGTRFDELLFESRVGPNLGWRELPGRIQPDLLSLSGVRWILTSKTAQLDLSESKAPAARLFERIIFGGFAYGFYRAIESAKIALSSQEQTAVRFVRPGININIPLMREEFESLIESDLAIIQEVISATLDQAGVPAEDINLVLRTGGSGSIPAFVRQLNQRFGFQKVEARPAFTSVVHGLGLRSRELWG
jgi:hypothetical chaperone protein